MKIGRIVKNHTQAIFEYCERNDASEFVRLQEPGYSKDTFGINYPFCKEVAEISQAEHARYWSDEHKVHDVFVQVTNDWYAKSIPLFRQYLSKLGIPFDESLATTTGLTENIPDEAKKRGARGRYRGSAIGIAQNAFVRHLLSRIGDEQFSADQWQAVISDFDQRCAYCGAAGDLVMEHVIPINRTALGEHRLGNLVPACRSCNATKSDQDYRSFLAQDKDKIAMIEAHMAKHNYVPIGDNQRLRQIIEFAHQDVRQLADRYAAIIDTMLADEEDKT